MPHWISGQARNDEFQKRFIEDTYHRGNKAMNTVFRQQIKADANHMIHLHLPPGMGDDVEVIVFSRQAPESPTNQMSHEMAQLFDETGFANKVLNSSEEDCWNDL